jgi:hypothetical protein
LQGKYRGVVAQINLDWLIDMTSSGAATVAFELAAMRAFGIDQD